MRDGIVLPYIDIPFQHASPKVLKDMRRPGNQEKTLERIRAWRETCPDLTIRSTFIVGFPGESEDDFRMLLDWLEEAKLDRVGAFKYEPVGGARANDLGLEQISDEIKQSRWRRFMETGRRSAPETEGQGRQTPRRADRSRRWSGSSRAAARATRPRSTAPSMSRRAAPCAPATSSTSRSSAPTPMICGGRRDSFSRPPNFFQAFSKLFANFRGFSASFSKFLFGGFGEFQRVSRQKIW